MKSKYKDINLEKFYEDYKWFFYILIKSNFPNKNSHLQIMKYLENNYDIHNRDDSHIRDDYEMDAYLLASSNGYLEIMKYLEKEHDWNILIKDDYEMDAYLLACSNGHLEIMKYLEQEHNWNIHLWKNLVGMLIY